MYLFCKITIYLDFSKKNAGYKCARKNIPPPKKNLDFEVATKTLTIIGLSKWLG